LVLSDVQRAELTRMAASSVLPHRQPMNLVTGQVLTELRKSHKGGDVLRFFKQIDTAVPRGLSVHVVLDNLSAHSAPEVTK
jgi:hypothetical protein